MTSSADRIRAKLVRARAGVSAFAAAACLAGAPPALAAVAVPGSAGGMLRVPASVAALGGDSERGSRSEAPARLVERATAAVAERWGVAPAAVVLSCGRWSEELSPLEIEAPLRLSGRGQDGRFAVVLLPGRGRAVTFVVRAGHRDSIAVATRTLENGHRLTADDVRLEARVGWGPKESVAEELPGPGWVVRRALAAGEPLVRPGVAPPELVAAGEPVKLVWARGTVSIALDGLALHGACRGETVSARVAGRTERVRGIVIAPGTAELASEVTR